MRVVVAGGTGFIGRALIRALLRAGNSVLCLTRDPDAALRRLPQGAEPVRWDPRAPAPNLAELLSGASAVINLSGASISQIPWTLSRRAAIRESRVLSTRRLVEALAAASPRPALLLNASAVGYYGDRGEEVLTERSDPGSGFLGEVVRAWEAGAREADALGVRVVMARFGLVLGLDGGALPRLLLPVRLFAGATLGSGVQWVPWVHIEDVVGLLLFALEHRPMRDAVNVVSPNPVRMGFFMAALGRAAGRPIWLRVPEGPLRAALGEAANLFLASQRAMPEVALSLGYTFRYPHLDGALQALLQGPSA